jgi:uncharacterized membrane protein YfcA
MDIYLPIAETSVNIFVIISVGIITGIVGGLFGVGGSFLGIPILMSYGIEQAVVVASYTHQMITNSFMSVPEDRAERKIDVKLALITFIGGSVGSISGSFLFKYLTFNGQIEFATAFIYIFILGGISLFMIVESLDLIIRKYFPDSHYTTKPRGKKPDITRFDKISAKLAYQIQVSETKEISAIFIILFGLVAGLIVSMAGIASGFIMIPIMIYVYKMNIRKAIATSNIHGGFLVVLSTIVQTLNSHTVDLVLSIVLTFSTAFGSYFAKKISTKIPAEELRISLGIIMFFLICRIISNIISEPARIFTLSLIR